MKLYTLYNASKNHIRMIIIGIYISVLILMKIFWGNFIMLGMIVFLLFFIFEEGYGLFIRKKDMSLQNASRVRGTRFIARLNISLVLGVWAYFYFSTTPHPIWVGAYIGFITNALVTVLVLHTFIPMMKENIAKQFDIKFKSLLTEQLDDIKEQLLKEIKGRLRNEAINFLTVEKTREIISELTSTLHKNNNTVKKIISDIFSYNLVKELFHEYMPQIETYIKELLSEKLEETNAKDGIIKSFAKSLFGVDNTIRTAIYNSIEKLTSMIDKMTPDEFEKHKQNFLNSQSIAKLSIYIINELQNFSNRIPDDVFEKLRNKIINNIVVIGEQKIKNLKEEDFRRILNILLENRIESTIKNMKLADISAMMDLIMGNILTSIEIAGALLGAGAAFLMS